MTTRKRNSGTPTTAVEPPATPAAPRYLLVTLQSGVQIYSLPANGSVVIGRGEDCWVALAHGSLSRQHARLEIGTPSVITDLDSRNGTFYRGQRLTPHVPQPLGLGESFNLASI